MHDVKTSRDSLSFSITYQKTNKQVEKKWKVLKHRSVPPILRAIQKKRMRLSLDGAVISSFFFF